MWKEAVRDHVQNRTHRLYRVCLVQSERMSNEQKTPGGTGVREMETDRGAKRRRQQLGRRGRRKTVEERQIGEQGEGNRNNEEEGSDREKSTWRTKKGSGKIKKEREEGKQDTCFCYPLFLFLTPYTYVPSIAHSFLPRSLSFISPLYLSILPLALLPFFVHVRSPPFSALAFLVSSP